MNSAVQKPLTVRYFASLREKLGCAEELIALPPGVFTVQDLITLLRSRGEQYERAFADRRAVRVALDQIHARPETRLDRAREVAFFPPVTGG